MADQIGFPSPYQPIAQGNRQADSVWYTIWQTLFRRTGGSNGPIPAVEITPDGSPFEYESDLRGSVVVQGGTVSEIAILRDGDTIITGMTAGMIPVMPGDIVRVAYSADPTMTFLPSEVTA